MIDNRESDFIFIKWLFFIVGLIIFLIIFYKFGFITDLIKNDVSFISPLIILIFIFFTIHVGYILYNLKTTYKNCLLFKDECSLSKKENKSHINNFKSSKVTESNTLLILKDFFLKNKIVLDPHTAVGIAAEKQCKIKKHL